MDVCLLHSAQVPLLTNLVFRFINHDPVTQDRTISTIHTTALYHLSKRDQKETGWDVNINGVPGGAVELISSSSMSWRMLPFALWQREKSSGRCSPLSFWKKSVSSLIVWSMEEGKTNKPWSEDLDRTRMRRVTRCPHTFGILTFHLSARSLLVFPFPSYSSKTLPLLSFSPPSCFSSTPSQLPLAG